jgi:hypothetical protein
MAASHPKMVKPSFVDEGELLKLVKNHLLPNHIVLQWWSAKGEDIPTPNTNDIMVLTSFFQHRFNLPSCEFLCGLLHHYKIELLHLNPNFILQIIIFVHLCECYLAIHPNFLLFKHYFFLKCQPSDAKREIIGGVGTRLARTTIFLTFL